MKREVEILKAGIDYTIANKPKSIAGDNFKDLADILNRNPDFEVGAKWADAHPHWINVEDELPEYDQRVLWCWDDGLISIGRVALDEQHIEAGYITHWMPLPSVEHLKKGDKNE